MTTSDCSHAHVTGSQSNASKLKQILMFKQTFLLRQKWQYHCFTYLKSHTRTRSDLFRMAAVDILDYDKIMNCKAFKDEFKVT